MKSCVFCPNPRTTTRGEHIWDDWLNREDGRTLKYHYEVTEFGPDDAIIRTFSKRNLSETKPVVCDDCNSTWMSDVTNHSQPIIDGLGRHQRPTCLLPLGIVIIAALATMKAMVLDAAYESFRPPRFPRLSCVHFRESLTASSRELSIPNGTQIWLAAYRRTKQVDARFWMQELILKTGRYAGFRVFLITYVVSAFVFQLAYPRWMRLSRLTVEPPFLKQASTWDRFSFPIWPHADYVVWPPHSFLERDGRSLEDFSNRFGTDPAITRV